MPEDRGRLGANHQTGKRRLGLGLRIDGRDDPARTQHDAAVGELADFVKLVGDEENGDAFLSQTVERHEELPDGLGHEHRGGLIKNEELGIRHQGADDLHALALTHRELVDDRSGIHLKAVLLAERLHLLGDFGRGAAGRKPEGHVLGHRQRVEKREVLVHHRNAARTRFGRTRYVEGPAVELEAPLVGAHRAVDDLHEGGLAGAVLSEDGEHFTGRDIHVDAVVGNDPRVPLGDIFQAETWMHAEAGRRVGRPCQKLVRSGPAAARRATPDLNM